MNDQEFTPQIDKVSAALVAAQAEMPATPFDSTNPFLNNRYASLGSVIATSRPILAKHSLAVMQRAETLNGEVVVHTTVLHSSGQTLPGGSLGLSLGDEKGKSRAQVAGSIITYLRRYAWASILGLYADEDTDANTPPPRHRTPEPEPEPGVSAPEHAPKPPAHKKPTPATLSWALKALVAEPGGANRQTVHAFLTACDILPAEKLLEQWPLEWVPNTAQHLRDLGEAIAKFATGEPANMPYEYFSDPVTEAAPWKAYIITWGKLKDTALGVLPDDVLSDLWATFKPTDTYKDKKTGQEQKKWPAALANDKAFRLALDEAGKEKGFDQPAS